MARAGLGGGQCHQCWGHLYVTSRMLEYQWQLMVLRTTRLILSHGGYRVNECEDDTDSEDHLLKLVMTLTMTHKLVFVAHDTS